jgi:ribosomal protein S18 acetylase RimI-like enzyme
MQPDTSRVRSLPSTFCTKNGRRIRLELLGPTDGDLLVRMYLDFQPRNSFQGLPPIKDEVCIKWVREMLQTGVNVVAREGQSVVGHVALFAIDDRRCEMLVVVSPGCQNIGIGTRLTQSAVRLADELSYAKIWLPVDATNVRARHIYAKCGFEYLKQKASRELDMALDLAVRKAAPVALPLAAPHYLAVPAVEAPGRAV